MREHAHEDPQRNAPPEACVTVAVIDSHAWSAETSELDLAHVDRADGGLLAHLATHRDISNTADTRSVNSILGCRYRPLSMREPVTSMRSSIVFP